jgi:hypothetical protein
MRKSKRANATKLFTDAHLISATSLMKTIKNREFLFQQAYFFLFEVNP